MEYGSSALLNFVLSVSLWRNFLLLLLTIYRRGLRARFAVRHGLVDLSMRGLGQRIVLGVYE
jgi:hypothetical protein